MPTLDQTLDALIAAGVTPEQISLRARQRASEPTKAHFRAFLLDSELDPPEYAVQLTVTNWDAIAAFFAAPPTTEHNLQTVYRDILVDVSEALQTHNAEQFILSLMLGAKAGKP